MFGKKKMRKVEIIILSNTEEYREFYNKSFVEREYLFYDISVFFHENDFDHIFFEPPKEGSEYQFSKRRAKRMLFIREILNRTVDIELMYQEDRGTFAVFCNDLECVLYLRARPGSGKLQIGTFFDFGKNHEKMYLKQKKKCIPITPHELKNKL